MHLGGIPLDKSKVHPEEQKRARQTINPIAEEGPRSSILANILSGLISEAISQTP